MENGSVLKTSFGKIRDAVFKILFSRPVWKECIKRYDTPKIRSKLLQEKNCCLWFVKYISPQLNTLFSKYFSQISPRVLKTSNTKAWELWGLKINLIKNQLEKCNKNASGTKATSSTFLVRKPYTCHLVWKVFTKVVFALLN